MITRESPRLSVLILLSALAVLPMNMFVPSLPAIAREFGADFALVNVAVAGYALATAVTHLVAGALSDRFGRRPVALAALVVFTMASAGCTLANDIATFLVCRLFQGAVIAGYSVSLAAIRDTSDERTAASRIGYVSSAWAVVPMLGPTLGGFLDAFWGWRSSFVAFTIFGCAGLCLVAFRFKETNLRLSSSTALQVQGYRELGCSPRLWALALCMAFSIGTLYTFIGGAPLVAAQLGQSSSITLGMAMGIVPGGFILGTYFVGRSGSRHAAENLILAGRVLSCTGLLVALALWAAGATHPFAFFAPCVCVGLGNGLTMPAANARVLSIRPELAGTALGLAAALTVAGAAAVAFLSGLVVDPSNAHLAVLCVMLASSLLSLLAAMFVRAARPVGDA
jgi:DHA1 family bicyclomycin/chloramphenicol resistance-like MFS transporter